MSCWNMEGLEMVDRIKLMARRIEINLPTCTHLYNKVEAFWGGGILCRSFSWSFCQKRMIFLFLILNYVIFSPTEELPFIKIFL